MELKDFIKSTLVQLSKGIEEAKKELGDDTKFKTIINPLTAGYGKVSVEGGFNQIQEIEFDIALIVEQKSGGKAGIGVLASIITAGASKSTDDTHSETHRIKFKVPIKFA